MAGRKNDFFFSKIMSEEVGIARRAMSSPHN